MHSPIASAKTTSAEVLSFFECDVEESIGCLVPGVNVLHVGVTRQDSLVVHEERDGGFLA